ncbi:hypothetical protein 645_0011 [Lactococcus lactis phage 645]|nr:hypothetical protein 645_0011 [Lactococcus lactis phage 645]
MSLDNFKNRAIIWDTVNKDFPQPIQIMQGDVNARTLSVKIIDNGGEIDLTGHSLKLTYQYTNSSNSGFVMIPPENLTKGEFILVIPTEMTKTGVIEANLILLNEDKEQVIVSKNLTFISDNSTVTDLAQEVNNKIDDFTKLLLENMPQVMRSELNDLHAQTESNKSNIELKANLADMTSLQSAMTELKNEVEAFGISPENLVTIKSLLDAIASKASESEVVELINSVNVLTSNISLMSNGDYSPKANQTDLESLQHTVNDQGVAISTKAEQAEIIQARGGQSSLDARLDGLDAKDTDLQNQVNTNKTSITNTGSRIDNLIANAGNGTVPSELVDMRIGADGKVRGTAGNAMREQFQAVNMAATSSYDVFFTNGIVPSVSFLQDGTIKVSFPKSKNKYTRLNAFGRDGKKVAELWTYGFTENSEKPTFAESYTIPSGSSLLWNLSSNTLLVDAVDKTKSYLNINLLTNYSGVPSSGKFMEYITMPTSEKLGISFYISNGLFPTFTKSGTDLVITMPTAGGMYSRLFLNIKNTERILWPDGYTENAGKKLYQRTYTVPHANGLYWDTDTDSLQIAGITSGIPSSYFLLAANINGYIAAGEFYKYKANNVEKEISSIESVKNSPYTFINRQGQIGWRPENSLEGVLYAKENGYDNVRVSLRFTSDDVPVLIHDASINRTARNSDGSAINTTINISDITLKQANTYDWGILYGAKFAGIKLATLDEFMRVSAYKGIKPTLEIKVDTMTSNQVTTISNLILKYGLSNVTTISNTANGIETLRSLYALNNSLSVGLITHPTTTAVVDTVLEFKNHHNNVRLDIFDTDTIPPEILIYAATKNVGIKVGSAYSIGDIIKWVELGVNHIEVANVSYPKTALSAYYDQNF